MNRLCAIVFLAGSLASCALAHERIGSIMLAPHDAGLATTPDVSFPRQDAAMPLPDVNPRPSDLARA